MAGRLLAGGGGKRSGHSAPKFNDCKPLENHHVVNEVPAILLDQNHLRHEVPLLFSEVLLPDDGNRFRPPKSRNEIPLGEESLCALVVMADPFQALFL